MAACTEDFKDWSQPQVVPQPATVSFADGSVATVSTISLNALDEAQEAVQVCQITAPTASNAAYAPFYTVTLGGTDTYNLDNEGRMNVSDLQSYLVANYGSNPNVSHAIDAFVEMWIGDGATNVKTATSGVFQIVASPKAPYIEAAYYLTGSINGWDNTDMTYQLTNDGTDPYENPTYTCRINAPEDGSNIEFKMTPASGIDGDWSGCLAAGEQEGTFVYNNAGGNLVIEAVEGAVFYDLTFNMLDQTWSAKALLINIEPAYYLTGSINDWNNSDTTYKLTNDGRDPYENPTFTCRIPATEDGSNIEFKMTPESGLGGDWSKCLAAGSGPEGTFAYNNDGGNLVITAVDGAKFYDLTFNMMELTWSYKAVKFESFIYEIGNSQGWSESAPLYCPDGNGKYQGYYYLDGGFKFKPNADNWDGDWGQDPNGEAGKLVQEGEQDCQAAAGFYQIDVDLELMTYAITQVNSISIIGTVNGNWDTDTDLTYNTESKAWETTATLNAGAMKFRMNHDWAVSWGGANGDAKAYDNLTQNNGKDLDLEEAGTYFVQLFISYEGNNKVVVTKQ